MFEKITQLNCILISIFLEEGYVRCMAGGMENGKSNGVSKEVAIALLPGEPEWWKSEGPVLANHDNGIINRNWFPPDFLFGTGSAAYQVTRLPSSILFIYY